MGTTTVFALPYPELTDPADIPADIKKLAQRLDLIVAPALVTALPSTPVDGQEIYYQSAAMATAGIAWHLRYRAAATGSYKWEFVGGGALFAEVTTAVNTVNQTVYGDPNVGSGPSLTLPLAGDYDVTIGAGIARTTVANSTTYVSYAIGATAPVDADAIRLTQNDAATPGPSLHIARTRRKTGLAAVALAAKYRTDVNVVGALSDRWMRALPVRVG